MGIQYSRMRGLHGSMRNRSDVFGREHWHGSNDWCGPVDGEGRAAAFDDLFDSLSDRRRRYLLYHALSTDENVLDLDDAVAAVERYENATTPPDVHLDAERIRIALHHAHLPRLDADGYLDYDPGAGTVELADRSETDGRSRWALVADLQRLELG